MDPSDVGSLFFAMLLSSMKQCCLALNQKNCQSTENLIDVNSDSALNHGFSWGKQWDRKTTVHHLDPCLDLMVEMEEISAPKESSVCPLQNAAGSIWG